MEPDGQMVLDFAPVAAGVQAFEPRAPASPGPDARSAAFVWFERGCDLDADRGTWEAAADAYRHAIEIDPSFSDAHCNLGSVYFNQGDRDRARDCFECSLRFEPGHVEANLNLGTILEEGGCDEAALRCYRAALETSPLYADVHVSLALLYEKLGLRRTALSHWRRLSPARSARRLGGHRAAEARNPLIGPSDPWRRHGAARVAPQPEPAPGHGSRVSSGSGVPERRASSRQWIQRSKVSFSTSHARGVPGRRAAGAGWPPARTLHRSRSVAQRGPDLPSR